MNATYRKIVRGVALYDLLSTFGIAVPGLVVLMRQGFFSLHQALGLGGDFPEFAPLHYFFTNIAGMLVFLWSFARMVTPTRFLTVCDIYSRFATAVVMLYYIFGEGISRVFLALVATEIIGAVLQIWALQIGKDDQRVATIRVAA